VDRLCSWSGWGDWVSQEHKPQRRDKRYSTRLPIRSRIGGRMQSLFTEDVSFRGLFLCTESPPPVRQLIRIETVLPPNNIPFATHGMIVYVIAKDDPSGRSPGAGVQFYGMGDERRVWESFIQFIQWRSDQVPDRRNGQMEATATPRPAVPTSPLDSGLTLLPPVRTSIPPPVRATTPPPLPRSRGRDSSPLRVAIGSGAHENRRFHRFPIVLEVCPCNLDELVRLYSRDVSVGGMFLPTTREIPVLSELRLEIRHPHADSVFPMTAVVRRRSAQPVGVGVEFVGLDDRRRRQFFEFIHAPKPPDDDIEFIIETD
jgi:hypothetical protein